MDKRKAKVNISYAGGTAAQGARTFKVTLPNAWMNDMGVSMEAREFELTYDGTQIILNKYTEGEEFATLKMEKAHDLRLFRFYDSNLLCTEIYADFTDKTLSIRNYSTDPVKTAFGKKTLPLWDDLQAFLEERCIPRERAGLREYLEVYGLDEYDPIEIIKKTGGRMAEDDHWLEMKVM